MFIMSKIIILMSIVFLLSCKSKPDLLIDKDWTLSHLSATMTNGSSSSEFNKNYTLSDSALIVRFDANNTMKILMKQQHLKTGLWQLDGNNLTIASSTTVKYNLYEVENNKFSVSKIDSENNIIYVMFFKTKSAQWLPPMSSYNDMKDTANFSKLGIDLNRLAFP